MSVLSKGGLVWAAARPRARQNRLARTTRYLGLFAWFGGTAMDLIAVEGWAEHADGLAEDAWRRWLPVAQGAIAAQGYLAEQQGVTRTVKRARLPLPPTWER